MSSFASDIKYGGDRRGGSAVAIGASETVPVLSTSDNTKEESVDLTASDQTLNAAGIMLDKSYRGSECEVCIGGTGVII